MDSQEYIAENPRISVNRARQILDQHDTDGDWITFAFTDHPEAINAADNTVDTNVLLGWLGY